MIKDLTTEYAKRVANGDILASRKNIEACERHLRDMNNSSFKYHFDVEKANKVIKFISMLPDPKTGQVMKLARFQHFIIGSLMGWVDELGNRRFTKGYISMSRKNGKTLIVSGLSLYEQLLGKEPVRERLIGLTANSREQATIAYDMCMEQLKAVRAKSQSIKDMTKITESRKEILNTNDRSKIKAVSNEASNLEGYQFSYAIIDEYHEANDKKMYETLRRGQVLLNNPSLIIISTAGFNMNGPMFEEYQYITKILDGEEVNENYFAFVAEQDSEDEIHNDNTWIKSNPLLEVEAINTTLLRNLRAEVDEGVAKHDLNGILVKNFNLWRKSSESTYIGHQDWQACYTDAKLDIKNRDVYIGLDLSRSDDLTAVGMVFPTEDKGYFVDSHVFVGTKKPIQEKSKADKIDYMRLVETDVATLTNTSSGIINYEQVVDWLIRYIEYNSLNVKGIMFDPWNAQAVVAKLENEADYPLIEVGQNYRNLSPALKQFKLDVFEKKVRHNDNPNLNLAINNAVTKHDNNGNIILDKQLNRSKIDALVALTTAYTMAINYEFENGLEDYILSDDFGF